jgi:predicted nucleic acid-binding Zn ribbon protein
MNHRLMQRASQLIRSLRLPGDTISAEELACTCWPQAVGRKVAAHTRAVRMVRTRLIVEVEDVIWQRQLHGLSHQILRNLAKSVGSGVVEDVEFRVVPRKREPERAKVAAPRLFADEADGIADPVLRGIYKASRKKAQA